MFFETLQFWDFGVLKISTPLMTAYQNLFDIFR